MQQRTTSRDFARYLAFFSVEPWPEQRADFNSALLASVMARCLTDADVEPDAFVPDYWERHRNTKATQEPQTDEQIRAQIEQLAQVFPGAIIENKTRK